MKKQYLGTGMLELYQGRPQDVEAALAGGVGNDVDLPCNRHFLSFHVLS
jgi:hypothetical protein